MSNAVGEETGRVGRARVVLVVDDDRDCREMMCGTLRDFGYTVLESDNGADALLILLAENMPKPSVIVLDQMMPTMSGQELLRLLRSYRRFARIPVILVSAGPRYIGEGSKGAAWLAKPFDAERLVALVGERSASGYSPDETGEAN
jgi:two-component system response regulator MprA